MCPKIIVVSHVFAAAIIAACAPMNNRMFNTYADEIDLTNNSNSNDDATIRGRTILVLPILIDTDCYIYKPAEAKKIIVDAGPTKIGVACSDFTTYRAELEFEAHSGHEYEAGIGSNFCVRVVDIATHATVAEQCPHEKQGDEQSRDISRQAL